MLRYLKKVTCLNCHHVQRPPPLPSKRCCIFVNICVNICLTEPKGGFRGVFLLNCLAHVQTGFFLNLMDVTQFELLFPDAQLAGSPASCHILQGVHPERLQLGNNLQVPDKVPL